MAAHSNAAKGLSLSVDTTVGDIQAFLTAGGDVRGRMPNPTWFELSSGQYLALFVLSPFLISTVWITSYLFYLNSIVMGLLVGPAFYFACELIPRKYLLGYGKIGATVRLTLFVMFIVRSAIWVKVTLLVLSSVSIIGPAIYHGVQHKRVGEDNTVLHLAIFFECSRDVIRAIIQAGADVNAKNSDLNTPLHFAVYSLDIVHLLIESGASVNEENHSQLTPLDLVTKPGVAEALLKAGARPNAKWSSLLQHEPGSFHSHVVVPTNLGRKLRDNEHLCFLSHHKVDGATAAVYMHGVVCSRFKLKSNQVFLDSNSLEDIRNLINLVKASKVLVLLQTKNVLARPMCLAEIFTAVSHQIPIVTVNVEGLGYDFEDAKTYLSSPSFREALETRNPGASEILEAQEINVDDLGQTLGSVIPNIISRPFNPAASERVRASQIDDIIAAILEKL